MFCCYLKHTAGKSTFHSFPWRQNTSADSSFNFSAQELHGLCPNTEVIRVFRVIIHLTSVFHLEILTKWCPQAASSRFLADGSLAAHYEYASCAAFISMALPPPALVVDIIMHSITWFSFWDYIFPRNNQGYYFFFLPLPRKRWFVFTETK